MVDNTDGRRRTPYQCTESRIFDYVQQNHERRARSSRRRALTRKEQIAERWCHRGLPLARDGDKLVIALRKEEAGVLVMELSEHLWPEDLDLAISMVHDVARSRQNPLLLLVEVASDFDTSTWDVLWQILQPGILAQNRPSRVAVLKKTDE